MLSRNTRTICSFCKENGHTLKSCKTLAAVECKYCHELGHTTKHCPKLATKHHRRRRRTFKVINLLPEHADGFKTPKKTAKAFRQKNHPAKISFRNQFACFTPNKTADFSPSTTKQKLHGKWKKPLVVGVSQKTTTRYPSDDDLLRRRLQNRKLQESKASPLQKQLTNSVSIIIDDKKKNLEREPKKKPKFLVKRYVGSWADAADDDSDDEFLE